MGQLIEIQSWADFWDLVVDVWNAGILGIDLGRILVAGLILIGFLLLRKLFGRYVVARLVAWADRTTTRIDNKIVHAIEAPIRFVPVILGVYFAGIYAGLYGELEQLHERLVRSLIVFALFWALHRAVDPLSFLLARLERMFNAAMVEWLVKAIRVMVLFIGAATILEIWGIEVGPILAGLGLFGVAVALGAQDLFKNLIAGALIIAEKRFSIGDWIRVDGVVEGIVESIGFRSTFVRRFDKAPVFVPNAQLSDNAITNFSRMTNRRIYWVLGLQYASTIEQLRHVRDGLEAYLSENPDFETSDKVATFVRVDKFSDSSIDIMVYCFTKTTNWGEWLRVKEALAYRCKELVEEAGTGFAFPSRSIYVETVPGERPEIFVPPGGEAPASEAPGAPAAKA